MVVAVTGGAGYIGAVVSSGLLAAGHRVRVLDSLMHGQREVAESLAAAGAELHEGDVRDAQLRREALDGADAVVHLAAIVGDPACARDPDLARAVNVDAARDLFADVEALGVERIIFASTCSNYGRMSDPTVPIDESGVLAPVSLYAEQKVEIEKLLLGGSLNATCLRFATIFGVAPRMRFDLTINEFTRELWADRELEVFGELFWRPYVHVREAARAVEGVLAATLGQVAGEVFNVGSTAENYRKQDLVEIISKRAGRGTVSYVHKDEDPRDYKVSFEKVRRELGFEPRTLVPEGVSELVSALDEKRFGDPFQPRFSNTA